MAVTSKVQNRKFAYLFDIFDFNDDKVLNEKDFKSLFQSLEADSQNPQAAYKASRRWWRVLSKFADKNADGKITATEWVLWSFAVVTEIRETGVGSKSFQRLDNCLFESIETSDEASNHAISLAEYTKWMAAFQIKGDAAEIFAKLDTNGDGKILRSEFSELFKDFFLAEDENAAGNYLWGNPFVK
jgi:Ca2+-binding EF-hand superfamily protein